MKPKQFGDLVMVGLNPGVVVGVDKKRKWTYYAVVFVDALFTSSDFHDTLVEYEYLREDKLE